MVVTKSLYMRYYIHKAATKIVVFKSTQNIKQRDKAYDLHRKKYIEHD